MYSEDDLVKVSRQLNRRALFFLAPALLLLAGTVFSFLSRVQWLSAGLLSLLMAVVIASLYLGILPVKKYRDFLQNAVHGKTRREELAFHSMEEAPVEREGVKFLPVLMLDGNAKEGMAQRQYYYDANLPLPAWQKGERLRLTSHERMITAWERV